MDLCRLGFNSCQFSQNQVVLAGDRNRQKKPKTALNQAGTVEIGFGGQISHLRDVFCESRHSNVFFKNILIVKIYRKYK